MKAVILAGGLGAGIPEKTYLESKVVIENGDYYGMTPLIFVNKQSAVVAGLAAMKFCSVR